MDEAVVSPAYHVVNLYGHIHLVDGQEFAVVPWYARLPTDFVDKDSFFLRSTIMDLYQLLPNTVNLMIDEQLECFPEATQCLVSALRNTSFTWSNSGVEHKATDEPPCTVCGRDKYFCFCDSNNEVATMEGALV